MERKELCFDDGLVRFDLNGKAAVVFNPTDSAFVEKLFDVFNSLDEKQTKYKERVERITDKKEIFSIAKDQDAEMRAIIDELFGPVCAALFGEMNVYALANGLPVWCNLFLAIMDEIDTTFAREQKATNPRIAKYTSKYHG